MQAYEPLTLLRRLINDPITSGPRFTDASLLDFIDVAQVQAVRETSSPDAYQVFSTQNILTLLGTPTTGESVVLNINNVLVAVPETTGQTLTALAALVSSAVNSTATINTLVNSNPVNNTITFVVLLTAPGITPNSANVSMTPGVFVTGTMSFVQEYQVFEQLLTNAVYVAGQLMTPSSIAIMEGQNIGLWQQDPCGFAPAPGSGAVPGTVGPGAPAWTQAGPRVYPSIGAGDCGFKPTVQPYSNWGNGPSFNGGVPAFPGSNGGCQAQRYYWRDPGTLGLVPAPANLCQVVIYGVCLPPPVTTTNTTMIVPLSYKMYIVRYAEWLCRSSENTTNPGQQLLIENAYNDMNRERASCILKVRNAKGKIPRTFNSIPQRLARARYCVRRSGSRW
jgi:hypothetical protein